MRITINGHVLDLPETPQPTAFDLPSSVAAYLAATATAPGSGTPTAIDGDDLARISSTVTIPDVELMAVGEWNASSGKTRVDDAMLDAILAAAQDPDVDAGAIHFGHFDPRFPALSDGEPAVGWIQPTGIEVRNGRRTLMGTFTDVPAKLVDVITKAYRRRSVELAQDVDTARGRHPWTLSGLALLGVKAPAVKGLADVAARYSAPATPPTTIELEGFPGDTPTTPSASAAPSGGAAGHDGPRTTDPATQGATTVPKYTEKQLRAMLDLADDADVAAITAAIEATTAAPAAPAAPASPTLVVPTPPVAPAAPAAAPAAPAAPPPAATPGAAPAQPAAAVEPVAIAASAGTVPTLPPGYQLLSAEAWNALQTGAEFANKTRRDQLITTCLSAGQITPAEAYGPDGKAGLRAQLDTDEPTTTRVLEMLPKGRVAASTPPAGGAGETVLSSGDHIPDAAWDQFGADHFGIPLPTPAAAPATN